MTHYAQSPASTRIDGLLVNFSGFSGFAKGHRSTFAGFSEPTRELLPGSWRRSAGSWRNHLILTAPPSQRSIGIGLQHSVGHPGHLHRCSVDRRGPSRPSWARDGRPGGQGSSNPPLEQDSDFDLNTALNTASVDLDLDFRCSTSNTPAWIRLILLR